MSDSIANFKLDSLLPYFVLLVPSKLQTILSGKEVTNVDPKIKPLNQGTLHHLEDLLNKKKRDIRRRKNKKERKSLFDLKFEELKGFMDLVLFSLRKIKIQTWLPYFLGFRSWGRRMLIMIMRKKGKGKEILMSFKSQDLISQKHESFRKEEERKRNIKIIMNSHAYAHE